MFTVSSIPGFDSDQPPPLKLLRIVGDGGHILAGIVGSIIFDKVGKKYAVLSNFVADFSVICSDCHLERSVGSEVRIVSGLALFSPFAGYLTTFRPQGGYTVRHRIC